MDDARTRRLAERIAKIVAELLERRIKDPRLGFVTVTEARLTNDLREAKVFYTVLGTPEEREDTAVALSSATGIIRSEVGRLIGLRHTPSLEFIADAIPENAQRIDDLVATAKQRDEELARAREGAQWAGDPDPYKKPADDWTTTRTRREDDEDDETSDRQRRSGRLAVRPGDRRQAGRHDLARRRCAGPPPGAHPPRRPRGHARPDGHRRPGHRHREGYPAARPPRAHREDLRGDDPPRPVHDAPTTPRASPSAAVPAAGGHQRGADAEIARLTGEIMQVPPSVSAIKVNGQRAYKLTRAGEAPELAARPVTVYAFQIHRLRADGDFMDIAARVRCSSGTYIRALARDLGTALGTGGHLTALRRTAVGPYTLDQAHTLKELEDQGHTERVGLTPAPYTDSEIPVIPLAERPRPRSRASTSPPTTPAASPRAPSSPLPADWHVPPGDPVAAFDPDGALVALVTAESGRIRSLAVFTGAS